MSQDAEHERQLSPEEPAVDMAIESDPLQAALAEQDALRDRLLRTQAEMENYRKRVQRERDEERRYAAQSVVRDLLPVLDNLQRAIEAAEKGGTVDDLRNGVQMVLQQAIEMLGRSNVRPIEAVGQLLDPNLHEAITQMPSDQPPLTILQEVERGYTLHDRVLRPSKVIVAAPPSN